MLEWLTSALGGGAAGVLLRIGNGFFEEFRAGREHTRKLEEANGRITELSRTGGAGVQKGALVITPELQREVEKFQDEVDRLSEERRVIRRGLSEDVNSLGRRLQVLNLVAGPALAALLGLLYALSRRRKSA